MNKQQIMAELTAEGITEEKSYGVRAFPTEVRQEIILRDHFTCAYCNPGHAAQAVGG